MTRKPTREPPEKDATEGPSHAGPSSRGGVGLRAPQKRPQTGAASGSAGGYASNRGAATRRGIIYLDAETLRPIKPPIVVARKLERGDFASGWQVEFGRKLLAARTVAGMSQSDLARRSGINQPHISKLEAGEMEPRLSTIFVIADTLGVVARSLFPRMSWQAGDNITDS